MLQAVSRYRSDLRSLSQSSSSRFRCGHFLQGFTWLNPRLSAQFCESECLACSLNPVMLSVWFDPRCRPQTSNILSLLVPGKHGGPPRSSEHLLPPSPEPCSAVAPAPLTPLANPCPALRVSRGHQAAPLSPLLPPLTAECQTFCSFQITTGLVLLYSGWYSPEAAGIQSARAQVEQQFILNLCKYIFISFGALHSKAL